MALASATSRVIFLIILIALNLIALAGCAEVVPRCVDYERTSARVYDTNIPHGEATIGPGSNEIGTAAEAVVAGIEEADDFGLGQVAHALG